jgi:hypothetical protein
MQIRRGHDHLPRTVPSGPRLHARFLFQPSEGKLGIPDSRPRILPSYAPIGLRIEHLRVFGEQNDGRDPRYLAQEAAKRERRAWLYILLIAGMILVVTFGFTWMTW